LVAPITLVGFTALSVLSAKTLAMELPDIAPPSPTEKKNAVVGSSLMKHIDCSKMNTYRRIARELLKGENLRTSGRHVVVEEDVAIFLLLGGLGVVALGALVLALRKR
jgi:hypothetical protein